jgi:predicted NBD/HSP70 family sugar kinase
MRIGVDLGGTKIAIAALDDTGAECLARRIRRRQKAEGRRQKAEGRRQKAEGRRQKTCLLPSAF